MRERQTEYKLPVSFSSVQALGRQDEVHTDWGGSSVSLSSPKCYSLLEIPSRHIPTVNVQSLIWASHSRIKLAIIAFKGKMLYQLNIIISGECLLS